MHQHLLKIIGVAGAAIFGLAAVFFASPKPADCISTTSRPCYDRQAGNKTMVIESKAGEKSFLACLNSASESQRGEFLYQKTTVCKEEEFRYCFEGKSKNIVREFAGTCKPTLSCPSLSSSITFVSGFEPGWDDPSKGVGLRTMVRSKNGALYAGGFKGGSIPMVAKIYKSTDNGYNWTMKELPNDQYGDQYGNFVRRIIDGPGGALYTAGYRIWKSTNEGTTWSIISSSIADISVGEAVDDILYSKDGSLIALKRSTRDYPNHYNEVYKSTDGGKTWQLVLGPILQSNASYNFIEANDGSLVFSASNGDMYLYTDGNLQKVLTTDRYGANIHFLKAKDGTLYFVGGDQETPGDTLFAYRSFDNGRTWAKRGELPYSYRVAFDAPIEASDGSLWVIGYTLCWKETVYRSTDRGESWEAVAHFPESQYSNIIDNNSMQGGLIMDIAEGEGKIFSVSFEVGALFEVPR